MRNLLIALLMISTSPFLSKAQSGKKFIIDLEDAGSAEKVAVPFSALKVIDARFDQGNIGVVIKKASFKGMSGKKMEAVLPDSLRNYLPRVLSALLSFQKGNQDTLVLLVKQFRITDHIINQINQNEEPESLLNLSVSFYSLRDDNYFRLFSINDILAQKWMNFSLKKKNLPDLRSQAINELLRGIFENKSWKPSSVIFSSADIAQGLKKRFLLPVLTDTIVSSGLYKSFTEFINNKPSVTNIRISYKNEKINEVRDAGNKKIDLSGYWGACDGKTNYIVFRGQLLELLKSGKSFRFISYRQANDLNKGADYGGYAANYGIIPGGLAKNSEYERSNEYYYLNMDTGEVYLEELFGKSGLKSFQKDLLR